MCEVKVRTNERRGRIVRKGRGGRKRGRGGGGLVGANCEFDHARKAYHLPWFGLIGVGVVGRC